MGQRPKRIASELREYISEIIRDELKDPRIGFVTITGIEVSDDIKNAKVFFSTLGGEEEKKRAAEGLNSASGFIRKSLGEKMRIKFTPELIFRLDESTEYSLYLNKLFDTINKQKDKKDEHT